MRHAYWEGEESMNRGRLECQRHPIGTSEDEEAIIQVWGLVLMTPLPARSADIPPKPYFGCAINERR